MSSNDNWKDYPHVTSVIGVISKPALYYYYAKMSHDVSKDLLDKEFGEIWTEINKRQGLTKNRGTDIHKVIELHFNKKPYQLNVVSPYLPAVEKFLKEEGDNLTPLFIERQVYNHDLQYRGTCDFIGTYKGKLVLIDWKTGKKLYPEVQLQLTGYWYAAMSMNLRQDIETADLMAVVFTENGTYEMKTYTPDLKSFTATKDIYDFIQRHENR